MLVIEPSAEVSLPSTPVSLPKLVEIEAILDKIVFSAVVSLDSRPGTSSAVIALAFVVTLVSRAVTVDWSAFYAIDVTAEVIEFVLLIMSA